jgi:predicted O-methyltransferase YrrM
MRGYAPRPQCTTRRRSALLIATSLSEPFSFATAHGDHTRGWEHLRRARPHLIPGTSSTSKLDLERHLSKRSRSVCLCCCRKSLTLISSPHWMTTLKEAWPAICDFSVQLELPPSRWKYAWSTHELSAKRLYNGIRWRRPEIIVETGTFEGLGTFTMAMAAQENNNAARIFTIDYDGDPDVSVSTEDWLLLRHFRDENLARARALFPKVEIHFLNGDSREVLPSMFPLQIDHWDFFFQDSMHSMNGILAEWGIMKPFARPGSVVVFDDVCLDWKKMPAHLLKGNDFCGHFLLHEGWREGWMCRSTAVGRAQFWAQRNDAQRASRHGLC